MIQWILIFMLTMTNFMFINMKHPLAMGMTLLIQTLFISMFSSFMNNSFWFSYILFLIFIGGMLVLFIYVTSIASNEMFSMSMKMCMMFMFMMFMFLIFMKMIDKNILMIYKNLETKSIIDYNSYILENSLSLNKLYNYPTNILTILLINYLLITLIAIIKITKLFKGPLRPMFN